MFQHLQKDFQNLENSNFIFSTTFIVICHIFAIYFNSCFDGWSGSNCTDCLKSIGCVNGDCNEHPNTCICNSGWKGPFCDQPVCR